MGSAWALVWAYCLVCPCFPACRRVLAGQFLRKLMQ